jgi:hypothetical protein
VRIRQFVNVAPALAAKSALDSAGIECFLADDNTVRIGWFNQNGKAIRPPASWPLQVQMLIEASDAPSQASLEGFLM